MHMKPGAESLCNLRRRWWGWGGVGGDPSNRHTTATPQPHPKSATVKRLVGRRQAARSERSSDRLRRQQRAALWPQGTAGAQEARTSVSL